MTVFDDNPLSEQDPEPQLPQSEHAQQPRAVAPPEYLAGDPISYAAVSPEAAYAPKQFLPEDLRISWSWLHLAAFLFFGFASLLVIQIGFVIYLTADKHLSSKQLQQLLEANPKFIVGSNVLWFGCLLLFLYVTLAVLPDSPFWRSLGWKRLAAKRSGVDGNPWMYFFSGCALAILVGIASIGVKNTDHVPIQDLFKSRSGAFLLMAMAVFIAPLVEETVFRGYLYPLFASKFSRLAEKSGINPLQAVRYGTVSAVFLTGLLFGLMHGAQLGWTWGLVSMLILVGIVFTFARARTGTVLASFLLHLGYNSMIALSSIIGTKGFTQLPGK